MDGFEQKYKEALKVIESLYNVVKYQSSSDALLTSQTIEKAFPELKESENEKIRKEIYRYFRDLQLSSDREFSPSISIDEILAWLEKQGEQKPTDKVEPKFKIEKGKWYVCIKDLLDNYANKAFCKGDTYLSTQDGSLIPSNSNVPFEVICAGTYFRDWTIQDAKDGDVLYENDTKTILIFKSQICGWIKVYCDYWISKDKYTGGNNDNYGRLSEMKLMPATKEQRDLLFQKMKEIGYEWDAEKKKLNKIEQSCYHNDGLYYAIDILEKTLGKVEGYQSDDGKMEHQIAIETVNALYHKKPAEWSEEDERKLELLKALVEDAIRDSAYYSTMFREMGELNNWLKSLKDRVQPQPKQEWSEDEENRINAIKYLEIFDAQAIHGDAAIPCINWLKSLKFKPNHWKPSDEQMEIIDMILTNESMDDNVARILRELKEQLEKL